MTGRFLGTRREAVVHRGAASTERFQDVIGHQVGGVAVVTAADGKGVLGRVAEAVAPLGVEPPMLLVGLSRDSATGQTIDRCGDFVVNFLAEDQAEVAEFFSGDAADNFSSSARTVGQGCRSPMRPGRRS